jgi:hypothetical protein
MRIGLLLALLLLLASPTFAQGSAAALASPVAAPAVTATPDTLAALHRLFAAKRKKLMPIVAGTLVADVAGVVIIGSTVDSGGYVDGRAIGQAFTVILGVVVVGAEVLFYTSAYGKTKEQRAVAAFEAHRLPRHLKRQLKARYFQELPPVAHSQRLAGRGRD